MLNIVVFITELRFPSIFLPFSSHVPPVFLPCSSHFPTLFCFLQEDHSVAMETLKCDTQISLGLLRELDSFAFGTMNFNTLISLVALRLAYSSVIKTTIFNRNLFFAFMDKVFLKSHAHFLRRLSLWDHFGHLHHQSTHLQIRCLTFKRKWRWCVDYIGLCEPFAAEKPK